MNENLLIASWETSGKDFLHLFEARCAKLGINYCYRGKGCGGGLPLSITTREAAVAWMDNPWGHPEGTGACTVLRADRPSLKRVSL
jgi:hypothetical protein